VLDRLAGEPPNVLHPVVFLGRAITALERHAPRADGAAFLYGTGMTALVVGGAALAGVVAQRITAMLPAPIALVADAWLLKTTLSVRALIEAGHEVESCLRHDDLDGARHGLRALVSRDAASLDEEAITSAAVESLAENTADSIVAPLLAYGLGGLPGAFAYRAINTVDAMIGYHGAYEYLGKTAARLDDLANLVPARLGAGLLLAGGALAGGHVKMGLAYLRAYHGRTASPNAGWPMSAMAGLLGVRLEKPGHYILGELSPPPDLAAIDHAAETVKVTTLLAAMLSFAVAWVRRPRKRSAAE
jgi:adenosylcobinamide-phosphate synthase